MTKKTKAVVDPERKAKESMHAALNACRPELNAAAAAEPFAAIYGETRATDICGVLEKLTDGSRTMEFSERILLSQASALNVMYASLSRRAALNMGEYTQGAETYMKLALRAQNQCRMTLETLATIKNPPVVFAKQANIANNQQVNNGEAVPVARARETGNRPNEQSRIGHDKGQSLGGGTLPGAIGSRPPLEAVAAVNRSQDRKG